ncbi:aldose 1-epimerase [Psychromonas marina]|uniref:Aldose 1-epimerase n=1 Tax=Psychromonas marina TaxID=88364 RepID=A0ABQ6E444_9GAMM|nr:aldose epimerase family protein [Psychromonas marina]GLS91771.1 aldose 1-epimerase [Psychromonas marina]
MSQEIKQAWGDTHLYSLKNAQGTQVDISPLGATIVNFFVNDKHNKQQNIVLGFNQPQDYLDTKAYIGSVVGPWANRIAEGKFPLNGETISLELNEGTNHLHGASIHLDKQCWLVESVSQNAICLTIQTKEGDAGYPANINFTVTYVLNEENELSVEYGATTDKAVPLNVTQHTYFNLSGCHEKIVDHTVSIDADHYLKIDDKAIPMSKDSVANTAMDLRTTKVIKAGITADEQQIKLVNGYDHCWCLNEDDFAFAAQVGCESTGLQLQVFTDQNAIQLYTGNALPGETGREGKVYDAYYGLCLETQHYPDQVNMPEIAAQCIYSPSRPYSHKTVFKITLS